MRCLHEDGLQDGGAAGRRQDLAHHLLYMWWRQARHARFVHCVSFHFGLLVTECMYDGIGCKRVLKRDSYMVHEGDAYCHACYWDSRLFKPQGEAPAFGIHSCSHSSSIVVMNVCMYVCMIIRRRTSSFGGGATTGDCGDRCSRW